MIDYERRTKNSLKLIFEEIMPREEAELEFFGMTAFRIDSPFLRLEYMLNKLKQWFGIRDAAFEILLIVHERENSFHKLIELSQNIKDENQIIKNSVKSPKGANDKVSKRAEV